MYHQDDGSGTPILWIHGFPLSSAIFAPQTSLSGFRHIRPDLPGFGATPPSGDASMASYSRELLSLLDRLGFARVAVAGVSMGGYIAMQLLRDAPERVQALLLLGTRETPDSEQARVGRYKTIADVEEKGIGVVVESMLPKMTVTPNDDVRKIMESSSKEGVISALRAMAERPDSTETLRHADVPTLVLHGNSDPIVPVAEAERMVSLMANARIAVIENAAHLAHFERPEQANRAIGEFLRAT